MLAYIDPEVLKKVAISLNDLESVFKELRDQRLSRIFKRHKQLLMRLVDIDGHGQETRRS